MRGERRGKKSTDPVKRPGKSPLNQLVEREESKVLRSRKIRGVPRRSGGGKMN